MIVVGSNGRRARGTRVEFRKPYTKQRTPEKQQTEHLTCSCLNYSFLNYGWFHAFLKVSYQICLMQPKTHEFRGTMGPKQKLMSLEGGLGPKATTHEFRLFRVRV